MNAYTDVSGAGQTKERLSLSKAQATCLPLRNGNNKKKKKKKKRGESGHERD
jgi:hypothetical protein